MTFWQDARPATPRLRRPRPAPPSRRRWSWFLALGVVVIAAGAGLTTCRGATGASEGPAQRDAGAARPRIVPARWSRPLPEEPQALLADRRPDVVVLGRDTVSAFAARDGRRRWEADVPGVEPAAALDASTVLVAGETGFTAIERATGRVRWHTASAEPAGPVALLSLAGTPGVAVVSTEPGGLARLDPTTGAPRWSVRLTGRMRGRPALDRASGALAAVWEGGGATQLRLIDAASGAVRWARDLPAWTGSPVIASTSGGPLVIVGAGDGRYRSAIRAFGLDDGRERWHARASASFQPDLVPQMDGDALYVVDQLGTVSRLDPATGRRRWRTATGRPEFDERALPAGGALLLSNDAGEVFTLDAATGRMRARRVAAGVPVGLAAVRGRVVLAQRLVAGHGLQGFTAARLAAAGRPE
jgi:outer membrane protein assembly factor BamB